MIPQLAPHYYWMIGGVVLMIAEVIAPGFFLIWVGCAALLTGIAAWLTGIVTAAQFIVFAILAVISVLAAHKWLPYHTSTSTDPMLNQRAMRIVGQTVTVVEGISASTGRVAVGDGAWSARGCEAAAGALVKVTGTDGNTLIVENIN